MDILTPEIKPPLKEEVLGIRIEKELLKRFEALSAWRGMKASAAARLLIKHYVETANQKPKRGAK